MHIEGTPSGKLDVKRLHLPGVVLVDNCPACKREIRVDLGSSHLSFPPMNAVSSYYFYCHDCDTEWEPQVKFNVSLTVAEKP